MAYRGTPYTSTIVRITASEIAPEQFGENATSYGWFVRFKDRHKAALVMKTPSTIDLGRATWGRWSVMVNFFDEYEGLDLDRSSSTIILWFPQI